MQVTPLFATFFALLSLVAPLATQALKITVPTNVTTRNVTIAFTREATDTDVGLLSFYLVKNTTRDILEENIDPGRGSIAVTIPANLTGAGWTIQASTFDDAQAGVSLPFSIGAATPPKPKGMAVGIVVGVVAGVVAFALILLAVFLYFRRRRQQLPAANPAFNLEAAFPPRYTHQRSFSSASLEDTGNKSLEQERMQWEMELEGQFARARAGTPDILRGGSPMPRGTSPLRAPSPMLLAPQRAATRDTKY
ncbi:hypothetical protein B0H17DRAFT_1131502 [Mycena rosella]|uniref:Uncharacterized protein n=1 Tax=Mycena rosella TaxID=1033263 RepID=A0AAD7GM24_MYCRO|nr:hypothetical protein B0H17DRAFT_1131502 [Mycena rosella]